jgi:hypothetical protein
MTREEISNVIADKLDKLSNSYLSNPNHGPSAKLAAYSAGNSFMFSKKKGQPASHDLSSNDLRKGGWI